VSAVSKEELYRLVDALPESERAVAARVLTALRVVGGDGQQHTIESAPIDDEPETDEERQAAEEARREADEGKGIPAKVIFRRFGL